MHKLRKIHPPYGTEATPFWEFAYSEQVKVVNGLCEVELPATRDFLLNMGYQLVDASPVPEPVQQKEEPMSPKGKPRPRTKRRG